ncbi:MAG: DUF3859 domain-containing protein [Myxococcota bacterium]
MSLPSGRPARFLGAALCLTIGFLACGIPVPEDKQLYVGQWNNAETSLRIDSDGTVSYERRGNVGNVTINAPIQEFRGDDFVVGLPLLTTTFAVSRPPWFEGGRWRMIVDGAELVRVGQHFAGRSAEVGGIGVEILDVGIFARKRLDDSRPIIESTTRIPAKLGLGFGFSFSFDAPAGEPVVLTYHYVSPPLRDPTTGRVVERQTMQMTTPQGGPHWTAFDFTEPWELVPGEWTLSIVHGDRLLERRSFQVYMPG